jgi:hypothetical protein
MVILMAYVRAYAQEQSVFDRRLERRLAAIDHCTEIQYLVSLPAKAHNI